MDTRVVTVLLAHWLARPSQYVALSSGRRSHLTKHGPPRQRSLLVVIQTWV